MPYGWHSGQECHATAAEAAAQKCAAFVAVHTGTNEVGSCVTVNASGCSASPVAGNNCNAPATYAKVARLGNDISSVTANSSWITLQACELKGNPFVLSLADGVVLSWLVIAVWITAWVFKTYGKALVSEANQPE